MIKMDWEVLANVIEHIQGLIRQGSEVSENDFEEPYFSEALRLLSLCPNVVSRGTGK